MRAAEETVRTNNPSFKYIDGILADWHKREVEKYSGCRKSFTGT